eukprot:Opistho-2@11266
MSMTNFRADINKMFHNMLQLQSELTSVARSVAHPGAVTPATTNAGARQDFPLTQERPHGHVASTLGPQLPPQAQQQMHTGARHDVPPTQQRPHGQVTATLTPQLPPQAQQQMHTGARHD